MWGKQLIPHGGAAIFAPLPPACEERAPRAGSGACCRAGWSSFSREARPRTRSEQAGKKSDQDARRGGLAARADLTTPEASPKILSGSPVSKSLNASAKPRPSGFFVVPSSESENAAASAAARMSPVAGLMSPHRVTSRGNASPRLRVEFPGPWGIWAEMPRNKKWSGRRDLNPRLQGPKPCALPV